MDRTVILTAIGADRPGLTSRLADAVHQAGGNWLESHLSRMGGLYVGAVRVGLAEDQIPALEAAVRAIDPAGLSVALVRARGDAEPAGRRLQLELVGQDRPGIVREVTGALGALDVNILSLETTVEPMSQSGGSLFRANADLMAPAALDPRRLTEALERISAEVMADIRLGEPDV